MPTASIKTTRQAAARQAPPRSRDGGGPQPTLNADYDALLADMLARIDQHLDAAAHSIERAQRRTA